MNYSDFDSLTGLGNTRLMQARFAQCAGEQTEFGMILIDVDGLIYFNDRYGHDEGDEKLKQIAKLICQNLPDGIDVFRAGGEEFIIILTDFKMAEVVLLAMRICKAVNQEFSHLPPLRRFYCMRDGSYVEVYFPLTVSCGVAFYPEYGVDYSTLYRAAEEAAIRGGKRLYGGVVGVAMNFYSSCFLPSTKNKTNDSQI
ncbi:GGDEF domain-containing protein [Microcoleus sp. AR_TQ3_B6]|uniref:GGDEF domain-containing protein n=1 Tax=Microcoleus sp. AR_TQ3_B6 TaxID=3055284 RepID=UPI002FCE6A5D